jgi:hypothetical protein
VQGCLPWESTKAAHVMDERDLVRRRLEVLFPQVLGPVALPGRRGLGPPDALAVCLLPQLERLLLPLHALCLQIFDLKPEQSGVSHWAHASEIADADAMTHHAQCQCV